MPKKSVKKAQQLSKKKKEKKIYKHCPHCHIELSKKLNFCFNCNYIFPPEKKKKKKTKKNTTK